MFRCQIDASTELRLVEDRHADTLFALTDSGRAVLRQWLPWVDDTLSVDDTRSFIRGALQQFASGDGFQAGIWHGGALAGMIGFHYFNRQSRKTEIGYWLGAPFQGQGIMTRACRALLAYAFTHERMNRVEIRCASGNARSRAIPQRLGFCEDGVLRQDSWLHDHYVDTVVYSLLNSEWAQREERDNG